MERRVLTVVVSIVVAAVVFLVVYNLSTDDTSPDTAVAPDRAMANAAVSDDAFTTLQPQQNSDDLVSVQISHHGAALRSFHLLKNQFEQADRRNDGKSYIPDSRLEPGPYQLVGTWSSAFYPFQLEFTQLGWQEGGSPIVRLVRATTTAAWSKTGLTASLGEPVVDDLKIRSGDLLVVGGEEIPISAVSDDGAITLRSVPPTRESSVRIIRRGTPLEQYRADSTFTLVSEAKAASAVLVWPHPTRDTSQVYVERTWSILESYQLHHQIRLVNLGTTSLRAKYRVATSGWVDPFAEPPGIFSPPVQDWAPTCLVDGSHEEEQLADIVEEGGEVSFPGSVAWFGVNSQFFLLAAVFDQESGVQGSCALRATSQGVISAVFGRNTDEVIPGASAVCTPDWLSTNEAVTCNAAMAAFGVDEKHLDEASLDRALDAFDGSKEAATQYKVMLSAYRESQAQGQLSFTVFGGPKDLELLEAVSPTLDSTLDFWFVGFLAKPMLAFLKFLYGLVSIWWVAILLLTVVIRMAMLPLTQKSYVQMQKMKELKPEIDVIQKKYGNDKQRLQAEMMSVYKRHNMNPMGGCFPMLLQMPLYFALYRCLYAAVDLYQAPLFGWISDMTQPDPWYLLPLLLGVFMFVQQQMMPSAGGDEMQQKIIKYVMPVMFSVFMFMLPSGLVFYIFVSTVISVGQQYWIKQQFERSATKARSRAA